LVPFAWSHSLDWRSRWGAGERKRDLPKKDVPREIGPRRKELRVLITNFEKGLALGPGDHKTNTTTNAHLTCPHFWG